MKNENITNAINRAVAEAKAHFKSDYEHYEVWEKSDEQVTVRAWTVDGEDYDFFTVTVC